MSMIEFMADILSGDHYIYLYSDDWNWFADQGAADFVNTFLFRSSHQVSSR